MRWTEGYLAASQRPWRRRPRRGRSAWHACGWVSREPGRPRRLHLKDRRGAGTGSPSPRPWTQHLASDGAKPQVLGWYRRAKATKRGGMDRRGVGVSHSTAEAGELSPRDPVEGRGHRQVAPVEGKTANTPRLGPVSTSRHRIAELARQALGMAVAIAWLPGPAGTRRRVAKLSVDEPDAAEPARPDLWGARVSNDPGLPDPTLSCRIISTAPSAVFGVAVAWPASTDRAAASASIRSDLPATRRRRRSARFTSTTRCPARRTARARPTP